MTTKSKVKPLKTILQLLPDLERPDLALVEGKLSELLNGNSISRRVKNNMISKILQMVLLVRSGR